MKEGNACKDIRCEPVSQLEPFFVFQETKGTLHGNLIDRGTKSEVPFVVGCVHCLPVGGLYVTVKIRRTHLPTVGNAAMYMDPQAVFGKSKSKIIVQVTQVIREAIRGADPKEFFFHRLRGRRDGEKEA